MASYQPRFMLPPDFRFPPDGKIKPGIVLKESKEGFPDPGKQLYDGTSRVADAETRSFPEFHYSGDAKSNTKVGFWIDVLSVAELGLGGGRGHDYNLVVETGPAKTITFEPSDEYISHIMSDPSLAEYAKWPIRRPVYLITGVMVADSATIELQKGKSSKYQAKIMINLEGLGVPVKIGPDLEHETSQAGGSTWNQSQPFVLAYALKRIRKKAFGGIDDADYNEHALWGENKDVSHSEWEVEDFVQSFCESKEAKN